MYHSNYHCKHPSSQLCVKLRKPYQPIQLDNGKKSSKIHHDTKISKSPDHTEAYKLGLPCPIQCNRLCNRHGCNIQQQPSPSNSIEGKVSIILHDAANPTQTSLRLCHLYLVMSKIFLFRQKRVCQRYWTLYSIMAIEHLQASRWELFTHIVRYLELKIH